MPQNMIAKLIACFLYDFFPISYMWYMLRMLTLKRIYKRKYKAMSVCVYVFN